MLHAPMARAGEEPIGSMGNDAALAVLSDQRPPLFSYFKQLFAQVTNPPIDSTRESIVMSLGTGVGAEGNLLTETPQHAHQLVMDQPILRNAELETLRSVSTDVFRAHTIDITWPIDEGPAGMQKRLANVCDEATDHIAAGINILILSDRATGPDRAPIPSLLAVSAVHHHLVREGTRLRAGLVLESGEPREVHHFAVLIGYGASAINPYLMLDTVDELARDGRIAGVEDPDEAERRIVKGLGKAPAQDDLQDGDLDHPELLRRADLRGGRPREDAHRPPLHRHRVAHRRHRARRAGPRGARPPRPRVAGLARGPAARRRRLRLAARRRAPHVEPRDDRAAPARRPGPQRHRRRRSTTSTPSSSTPTPRAAPRCAAC